MLLRSHIFLLSAGVTVVVVCPGAESFQPFTNTVFPAQSRDREGRRRSPLTSIRGGFGGGGKFRSGAVNLGVGILALGSAGIYLCGSLASDSLSKDPTTSGEALQDRYRGSSSIPLRSNPAVSSSSSNSSDQERSIQRQQQRQQSPRQERRQERTMLGHTNDNYNGVIIDEKALPEDTDTFEDVLESSLEAWRSEGRKGVWLKVPADRTELVPVARELGFELHHAEKAYIMLNIWLPETVNQLPENASHQVGVGALVLNETGDILVVREKNGPLRGTGIWKFPTGLIDAGEDIAEAAAREVLEETGIHADFESVLAFRHGHRGLFGKSDLFFVIRMRLKPGTDANDLRAQVSEIEACQWMPRDLFFEQNHREGGTALLRALTPIIEAHLALEAEKPDLLQADDRAANGAMTVEAAAEAAGAKAAVVEKDARYPSGTNGANGGSRPSGASFVPNDIMSKYGGGKSKLYYGKL